jgi:hypothetical protein
LRCDDAPGGGGRAHSWTLSIGSWTLSERACPRAQLLQQVRATTYVQQHTSLARDGARVRVRRARACMLLSTRRRGEERRPRLHACRWVSHASYIMRLSSKAAAASWWLHAMTWAPLVVRSSYYRPRLACLGPPPAGSLGLEHWHAVTCACGVWVARAPMRMGSLLGAWHPTSVIASMANQLAAVSSVSPLPTRAHTHTRETRMCCTPTRTHTHMPAPRTHGRMRLTNNSSLLSCLQQSRRALQGSLCSRPAIPPFGTLRLVDQSRAPYACCPLPPTACRACVVLRCAALHTHTHTHTHTPTPAVRRVIMCVVRCQHLMLLAWTADTHSRLVGVAHHGQWHARGALSGACAQHALPMRACIWHTALCRPGGQDRHGRVGSAWHAAQEVYPLTPTPHTHPHTDACHAACR